MDSLFTHMINIFYRSEGADKAIADDERVRGALKWDNKAAYERELQNRGVAFEDIKKPIKDVGDGVADATGKTNDFIKAMNRALIVAPVWMVARSAIKGFTDGVRDGFNMMVEMNHALNEAKEVMRGYSGTAEEAVSTLNERVRDLGRNTGESITGITNLFTTFGKMGLNFEDAWKGAESATKFAMATGSNSPKLAQTLGLAFKNLKKDVLDAVPASEAFDFELAKIYKVMKTSSMSTDEFGDSLKRFLPTAKYMNISLDESVALIAALSSDALTGSRAGLTLATSFNKLLDNLPKVASELGVSLNPQINSTYEAIKKVLDISARMGQFENMPATTQQLYKGIFGGIRGGEAPKALQEMRTQLSAFEKTTTTAYKNGASIIKDYNDRQKEVTDEIGTQEKIVKQLGVEVYEGYANGIVGGKDFASSLKIIAEWLDNARFAASHFHEEMDKFRNNPLKEMAHKIPFMMPAAYLMDEADKAKKISGGLQGAFSLKDTIAMAGEIKNDKLLNPGGIAYDKLMAVIERKTKEGKGVEIINNVDISGGITTQDLTKALTEIADKVKTSGHYMGDKDLKAFIDSLSKSPSAKQQLADLTRDKM